jgi:hypothetical protein
MTTCRLENIYTDVSEVFTASTWGQGSPLRGKPQVYPPNLVTIYQNTLRRILEPLRLYQHHYDKIKSRDVVLLGASSHSSSNYICKWLWISDCGSTHFNVMYIRLRKAFMSYVLIFNQGGLFCYDVPYSPKLPGGMLFIKTRPNLREACSQMDRTFQVLGVQKIGAVRQ